MRVKGNRVGVLGPGLKYLRLAENAGTANAGGAASSLPNQTTNVLVYVMHTQIMSGKGERLAKKATPP